MSLSGARVMQKSTPTFFIFRIKEAIELCLEVEGKEIEPLDFVGVQQVSVAI